MKDLIVKLLKAATPILIDIVVDIISDDKSKAQKKKPKGGKK